MSESKARKQRHPPISIFHIVKMGEEVKYDAHQLLLKLQAHYSYPFEMAQLKLAVKNLNQKTLIPMGVKPIKLSSRRANDEYNKNAVFELIEAGKLEWATKQETPDAIDKPTKLTKAAAQHASRLKPQQK